MPIVLGPGRASDADYLDACRAKRNTVEYGMAGMVSKSEANELRTFTRELQTEVVKWLGDHRPDLLP